MTVWVVTFHNSRMPRFCNMLCSLHETETGAKSECTVHTVNELPLSQRKGAKWRVERWGTTPKTYVPTNELSSGKKVVSDD